MMQAVKETSSLRIFDQLESEVRSYIRSFPVTFAKSKGSILEDTNGKEYIDFFAGAGALNYGHNHFRMKKRLLAYIAEDRISHSLDMGTEAKAQFLERFQETILKPRKLDYKVMFPGPTGTNTVESALKLARKVTGRELVISFTNAFHGMTIGSLSITGNSFKRHGAGVPLQNSMAMPFDRYLGDDVDTIDYLERFLEDNGSGVSLPAAIILETVQGEGGLNVARDSWLKRLEGICRRWDILLIIDDVQVGCGRTGPFFSFETAGIQPDIVCLSKSISGYGLPMALTLIKPEHDIWEPGEHNGTFRGHNLAFITAAEALSFWETDRFTKEIIQKGLVVEEFLQELATRFPELKGEVRGKGLMRGLACGVDGLASKICRKAFEKGVVMETSGPNDEVFKIMPPLVIEQELLNKGLAIIEESVDEVIKEERGCDR